MFLANQDNDRDDLTSMREDLLLLLRAYHLQDIAAQVSAKLMRVMRQSACCCNRTKRISIICDFFLPSLREVRYMLFFYGIVYIYSC